MRAFLAILFLMAAGYAGTLSISGPVQVSGPVGILTNPGSSTPPEPDPPPNITADAWINFDTNSVGDAMTTNSVIATLRGFSFQSVAEPNTLSGFVFTNALGNLPFVPVIGGVSYYTNNTNAARYNHGSSPAQYFQLRLPADLDNVCVAFEFQTTFDGPGGGTYDLVQAQVTTGSDWISFNIKDNPSPYVVAHTGTAGSGSQVSFSANTRYWGQITMSNFVGYCEIFDSTATNRIGESSHPGSSTSQLRYIQFGQFGHSAASGEVTIFDNFLIKTNGDRILRQL